MQAALRELMAGWMAEATGSVCAHGLLRSKSGCTQAEASVWFWPPKRLIDSSGESLKQGRVMKALPCALTNSLRAQRDERQNRLKALGVLP